MRVFRRSHFNMKTSFIQCLSIALVSLVIILFSCNDVKQDGKKADVTKDSITHDVPAYYSSADYQKMSQKQLALMGLESLQSGYPGQQIRVWFREKSDRLLILLQKDSDWHATLWNYSFNYDPVTDTLVSISKNEKDVVPKMGFQKFLDSLIALKIFTLPDYNLLPDYSIGTDSHSTVVEIGTPASYRIYSYADPVSHQKEFWQAKNIVLIEQLIKDQFNLTAN